MPEVITLNVDKEKIEPINKNGTIGEQIKYYRCLAGMKQEDLALRIGLKRGGIYKYENEEIQLLNVAIFKFIIKELDIEDKIIINDDYVSFILENPKKIMTDFRNKYHLTEYEFAEILGLDVFVVRSWESGKRQITRRTYNKYKKILTSWEKSTISC